MLVGAVSCRQRDSAEQYSDNRPFVRGMYNIVITMPGDDFASIADLGQLQVLQDEIVRQGAGEPFGTGSGMGYMILTVKVDSEKSLRTIKNIVREHYPAGAYKIEIAAPWSNAFSTPAAE